MSYDSNFTSYAVVLVYFPYTRQALIFDRLLGKKKVKIVSKQDYSLIEGAIIGYTSVSSRSNNCSLVSYETHEHFLQLASKNIKIYQQFLQFCNFSVAQDQPFPDFFDEYVQVMRILETNSICLRLTNLLLGRLFLVAGFFCEKDHYNCSTVYQFLSLPLDGMLHMYHTLSDAIVADTLAHCVQIHPWYSKLTLLHRLPEYKV